MHSMTIIVRTEKTTTTTLCNNVKVYWLFVELNKRKLKNTTNHSEMLKDEIEHKKKTKYRCEMVLKITSEIRI